MLLRFLGRQATLAHQFVDERVVVGQLHQLTVAQAVRAAVTDVGDRDVLLTDVGGGQRRAHARLVGVLLSEVVDPRVRGGGGRR